MSRRIWSSKAPGSRRRFLKGAGLGALAAGAPHVFVPNPLLAQTSGRGRVKHLLYIRLGGGFRFPPAFNADVADEFNPFGAASGRPPGTEWGVGALLGRAPFLQGQGDAPKRLRELGMKPVTEIANQISVIPCVDHEPLAASADGNHQTALERFYTGYADGPVGFFTMINHGLRSRPGRGPAGTTLPAFVLGGSGMGRGMGMYAAHRPPVLSGVGFDRFASKGDSTLPEWASMLPGNVDRRMRDRHHVGVRGSIDAFMETRKATQAYSEIFSSPILKVGGGAGADMVVDGLSNRQLGEMFGDSGAGRNVRLALRLFHFGCPAIYLDQGGYDMHSDEETSLPTSFEELNRIVSALEASLKRLRHPEGGTYWDHTLVVFGSEFSRTARGGRFNSARGSDHGGDLATRWMSMPFMGGPVARPGRRLGQTRKGDLKAEGKVYSYRSVLKTLLDGLGCDHKDFFPADAPFDDLYA